MWPLGTNFSEILIEIFRFWVKKMHLKMSSRKWRPFCLALYVLKGTSNTEIVPCQGVLEKLHVYELLRLLFWRMADYIYGTLWIWLPARWTSWRLISHQRNTIVRIIHESFSIALWYVFLLEMKLLRVKRVKWLFISFDDRYHGDLQSFTRYRKRIPLTHYGLLSTYGDIELDQHWFR